MKKNKKNKLRFTSITVAAIFIIIVVVFFVAMAIYGSISSSWYSGNYGNGIDAAVYENESSYLKFLEENGMSSENAEDDDLQFVKGASKQLWFDEGNIWTMYSSSGGVLNEKGKTKRKNGALEMTIAYSVSYNENDNTYHIEGHLSFDDSHASIFTFLKENTLDCIAVTWGGDLYVDSTSTEASATYSNGESAYISRSMVSYYKGVTFLLEERSGNKYIEDCTFELVLEGADDPTGGLADIDVRYFHTYGTSSMYLNTTSLSATSQYVGVDYRDMSTPIAQYSGSDRNIWWADIYMTDALSY